MTEDVGGFVAKQGGLEAGDPFVFKTDAGNVYLKWPQGQSLRLFFLVTGGKQPQVLLWQAACQDAQLNADTCKKQWVSLVLMFWD